MRSDHLIDQARLLARQGAKRPRQADLRRSVSASYYAVFHEILNQAVLQCVATGEPATREAVRRSIDHGHIKQVCRFVLRQINPTSWSPFMPRSGAFGVYARDLAGRFGVLIEARHNADYSTLHRFTRIDGLNRADDAESALGALGRMSAQPDYLPFLMLVIHGRQIKDR